MTADPQAVVLRSILDHTEAVPLIYDLKMCLLRNRTDDPFIFSDSPVVFYNTYYRKVIDRGVLGLQTPGLQVFMPLDSRTTLMLIDATVYEGRYRESDFVDIVHRSDISHLNAIQLHHSSHGVYFSDRQSGEYVRDLLRAHADRLSKPKTEFHIRKNWLVDGQPTDELDQVFERQLDHQLELSFVECTPIEASAFHFRRRCPDCRESLAK